MTVVPHIPTSAIASLEEIADQLRQALERMEEERRAIDRAFDDIQLKLRHIEQARQMLDSSGPATNGHSAPIPSKREAALAVLSDLGNPMKLAEIREEMIRRGWLARTHRAAHALQMTLSTLAKEGKVERPTFGVYKLADPAPGTTGEER